MKALDVDAVEAFVMVADFKSFTRAAEALDTTQSAISLKIKRLEAGLGQRLLERTPRLVRLSVQGGAFLGAARHLLAAHQQAMGAFSAPAQRLKVGISHHLVGAELPLLLRQLKETQPLTVFEIHVSTSRDALQHFDDRQLDAAVVLQHDNRRQDGEVILSERFGWMASRDFSFEAGQPLPLATQAPPCSVRSMAIEALDRAGVAWQEAFVGGGNATVGAAVSAGLAVAALPLRIAPAGTLDVTRTLSLPPLPARDAVLYANSCDVQLRQALRSLTAALKATAQ
jgi:DNA-binding transcriptional LysR family regulator